MNFAAMRLPVLLFFASAAKKSSKRKRRPSLRSLEAMFLLMGSLEGIANPQNDSAVFRFLGFTSWNSSLQRLPDSSKEDAMSNVSKQIYRKIDELFPDMQHIEPFTKMDLKDKGLPEINMVVFDSTPNKINFVLSRYENENGRLVAKPSFEVAANPKKKTAKVVTYKDDHYFHAGVPKPDEIGEMAQSQANRFLYDFLSGLKGREQGVQR